MKKYLCLVFVTLFLFTGCNDKTKQPEDEKSPKVVIVYETEKENPSKEEMNTAASILKARLEEMNNKNAKVSVKENNRIEVESEFFKAPEKLVKVWHYLKFVDSEGNEVLNGTHIKDASSEYGKTSELSEECYYISLELTERGRKAFYEATARNVGQQIYIILDDAVISAPTVNEAINDTTCVITGDFTQEEAKQLAANIKSGQLPLAMKISEIKINEGR
ncbi:MAG: hypothetical protein E7415_00595 [Ruminococcaceae bacterium]|nr:hypothetical protein [Oscillospiraceae bacterium]